MLSFCNNTINYYRLKKQVPQLIRDYIKEHKGKPENLWVSSFMLSPKAKSHFKRMGEFASKCFKDEEYELFLHEEVVLKFREFNAEKHEEYCNWFRETLGRERIALKQISETKNGKTWADTIDGFYMAISWCVLSTVKHKHFTVFADGQYVAHTATLAEAEAEVAKFLKQQV